MFLLLIGAGINEIMVLLVIFFVISFFMSRRIFKRRMSDQRPPLVIFWSLLTSLILAPVFTIIFLALVTVIFMLF
jgi:hypothetical protein